MVVPDPSTTATRWAVPADRQVDQDCRGRSKLAQRREACTETTYNGTCLGAPWPVPLLNGGASQRKVRRGLFERAKSVDHSVARGKTNIRDDLAEAAGMWSGARDFTDVFDRLDEANSLSSAGTELSPARMGKPACYNDATAGSLDKGCGDTSAVDEKATKEVIDFLTVNQPSPPLSSKRPTTHSTIFLFALCKLLILPRVVSFVRLLWISRVAIPRAQIGRRRFPHLFQKSVGILPGVYQTKARCRERHLRNAIRPPIQEVAALHGAASWKKIPGPFSMAQLASNAQAY